MFYTSCSSKLCQVHSTDLPSSLPPLQTTTGPCHWHGSARGSNPDQGPLGLESGHQKTSEKRWKKKWYIFIYNYIIYKKTTRICGGQCCSEVKKSAPVRRRCPPHKRLHQANHLESCVEKHVEHCGTGMFRNDRLCMALSERRLLSAPLCDLYDFLRNTPRVSVLRPCKCKSSRADWRLSLANRLKMDTSVTSTKKSHTSTCNM